MLIQARAAIILLRSLNFANLRQFQFDYSPKLRNHNSPLQLLEKGDLKKET